MIDHMLNDQDYEAYVLSIGEYDERVFLGEDAPDEIGTPAKVLQGQNCHFIKVLPVLWIRITLTRIRIRLITLMRIRIQIFYLMRIRIRLFTLMRIRIQTLASLKKASNPNC
jgi:hypothetical protein